MINTPIVTRNMEVVDSEQALQRAWDALQSVPSYVEENARQFVDLLDNDTRAAHSEWASDAHADIQAGIDILNSLRLAGKITRDDYSNVCFFLQSAQGWMNNMTDPADFGQGKGAAK